MQEYLDIQKLSEKCQPTARDEPNPKGWKTQQSAGKVMASVLRPAHGLICNHYFGKGQTINFNIYIAFFLALEVCNHEKTASFEIENSAVSSRQCTASQINENDGKIA